MIRAYGFVSWPKWSFKKGEADKMKKNKKKWKTKKKDNDLSVNTTNSVIQATAAPETDPVQGNPAKNVSGIWVLLIFIILMMGVFFLGWLTR
jgi:hypothetical protein